MTPTFESSTLVATTDMLVEHIAARLAIAPESIDIEQPVFGVDGAAVGPVILDSMELVEMVVDLEGHLGVALLDHFDDFEELSIAAMAAIVHDALGVNDRSVAAMTGSGR